MREKPKFGRKYNDSAEICGISFFSHAPGKSVKVNLCERSVIDMSFSHTCILFVAEEKKMVVSYKYNVFAAALLALSSTAAAIPPPSAAAAAADAANLSIGWVDDPLWPGEYPSREHRESLVINIRYDDVPEQTRWVWEKRIVLLDDDDAIKWEEVDSGGRHVVDANSNNMDIINSNTSLEEAAQLGSYPQTKLVTDTRYRLRIRDTHGNGLAGDDQRGWVTITTTSSSGMDKSKGSTTGNSTIDINATNSAADNILENATSMDDINDDHNDGTVLYTLTYFGYEAELEVWVDAMGKVTLTGLGGLEFSHSKFSPLHGPIPTELGMWTTLERLDLSSQHLQGNLPSEIAKLTRLQSLLLAGNQISGSLPTELGLLSDLEVLDIGKNDLTGTLPSEVGSMSALAFVDLSENDITGGLPSEVGFMNHVRHLDLSGNGLSKSIPSQIGAMASLEWLRLSKNLLASLPSEVGLLSSNLAFLDLSDNDLTSSLPTFFGEMTRLTSLVLYNNNIFGTIPTEIGLLTLLEELYLEHNQVSGPLPSQVGLLTSLTSLKLRYNNDKLTGEVPESLCKIRYLTLDCNDKLCGCPSRPYDGCPCVVVSRANAKGGHYTRG